MFLLQSLAERKITPKEKEMTPKEIEHKGNSAKINSEPRLIVSVLM